MGKGKRQHQFGQTTLYQIFPVFNKTMLLNHWFYASIQPNQTQQLILLKLQCLLGVKQIATAGVTLDKIQETLSIHHKFDQKNNRRHGILCNCRQCKCLCIIVKNNCKLHHKVLQKNYQEKKTENVFVFVKFCLKFKQNAVIIWWQNLNSVTGRGFLNNLILLQQN